jgi:hypothetical protein
VWRSSKLGLVVFCLVAIADGCDSAAERSGTGTLTVVQASPTQALSTTSGIENAPSGAPAPTKVQGHWLLVSKPGYKFKNRFELPDPPVITGSTR